ncbi:MAG: hypothetical protein C0599_12205, partial [Salinivirgaceae bacterium]
MNRSLLYILFLILSISSSYSQSINSWIKSDQYYYKIGVANEGIIRVSLSNLTAAGVPTSSFSPENIQVFSNGQEIPIKISTSSGVLNYFEFYGKGNDGSFDIDLYTKPSAQTNPFFSQINDTAAYFFTWNNQTNNRRYAETAFDNQ